MEASFKSVVEKIFQNWTALQLGLQHSRVNPTDAPSVIFSQFVDYMVDLCLHTKNVDQFAIKDALDDIMDQEFEAVCEDDSTHEISVVLERFTQLLKEGHLQAFEEEYQKLPVSPALASSEVAEVQMQTNESSGSSLDDDPAPETLQTEQSEWIEVKGRRKH